MRLKFITIGIDYQNCLYCTIIMNIWMFNFLFFHMSSGYVQTVTQLGMTVCYILAIFILRPYR